MFKLIHSHKNSKDLTFTDKTFKTFLSQGEIRYPDNWETILIVFGCIKIKL